MHLGTCRAASFFVLCAVIPWRCTSSRDTVPPHHRSLTTGEWETSFTKPFTRQENGDDSESDDERDAESDEETDLFEKWLLDAETFQEQQSDVPSPSASKNVPSPSAFTSLPDFFPPNAPFATFRPTAADVPTTPPTTPPTTLPVAETDEPTEAPEPTELPTTKAPVTPKPTNEPSAEPLVTPFPVAIPTTPSPTKAPSTKAPKSLAPTSVAPMIAATPAPSINVTTAPTVTPVVNVTTVPTVTPVVNVTTVPTVTPLLVVTTAPSVVPIPPPPATETVSELVVDIRVELVNVSTAMTAVELEEWRTTTETWFNEYYAGGDAGPVRLRRRRLDRSLVSAMNTTLSGINQTVTTNNTNLVTYAQQLNYVVSNTSTTTAPAALIMAIYRDAAANTDYHQRLVAGTIVALDGLGSPIPVPRIGVDDVEPILPVPTVAPPAEVPTPTAPTAERPPVAEEADEDEVLSAAALAGIIAASLAVVGLGGFALFARNKPAPPAAVPVVTSNASVGGGRSVVSAGGTASLASRKKRITTPTAHDISVLSVNEQDPLSMATVPTQNRVKAAPPSSASLDVTMNTMDTTLDTTRLLDDDDDDGIGVTELDESYEGKSVDTGSFDYSKVGQVAAAAATAASDTLSSPDPDQRSTSVGEISQDDGGSKTSKYADSDLPIEEDHFVIYAPAGKLGLVVDNPDDGAPVVHAIKEDSVLIDQVKVGDRLVGVDEIDVRSLSPVKVSKLISKRSTNPLRKLTLIRSKTDLDDDVTESAQSTMDTNSQMTGQSNTHRRNDSDDASSNIGSMSHISGDDGNDSIDFHDDNSQIDAMSQTGALDDDAPADKNESRKDDP